ncbi:unnamed protein product [Linum trigynum]|uniref:Uncharacterized protein n=1 Tax=Linum trigynum TaxID=586398 RepID=A0AAV2G549_9ROSI
MCYVQGQPHLADHYDRTMLHKKPLDVKLSLSKRSGSVTMSVVSVKIATFRPSYFSNTERSVGYPLLENAQVSPRQGASRASEVAISRVGSTMWHG